MKKPLWKSTIVIWTEFDPYDTEIDTLAWHAMEGDGYCSRHIADHIADPESDPDWDGTEFFWDPEE